MTLTAQAIRPPCQPLITPHSLSGLTMSWCSMLKIFRDANGAVTSWQIVPVLRKGTTYYQCNDVNVANSAGYEFTEMHVQHIFSTTNVDTIKVADPLAPLRHSSLQALVQSSPSSEDPWGAAYTTEAVSNEAYTENFEFKGDKLIIKQGSLFERDTDGTEKEVTFGGGPSTPTGAPAPDDATISGTTATFTQAQLDNHPNGLLIFMTNGGRGRDAGDISNSIPVNKLTADAGPFRAWGQGRVSWSAANRQLTVTATSGAVGGWDYATLIG